MTRIHGVKVKCFVCGREEFFTSVLSTNTFGGSCDLDCRPPEMKRSTLFTWVQRCPHCGYCSNNLADKKECAEKVINTEYYRNQLGNNIPEKDYSLLHLHDKNYLRQCEINNFERLINSFLCAALIDSEEGNRLGAIWNSIYAAWVCDDAKRKDQAKQCRLHTIELIKSAEINGDINADKYNHFSAILVDLLRRSELYTDAKALIEKILPWISDETTRKVLRFEKLLIDCTDSDCYTIEDVSNNKDHL